MKCVSSGRMIKPIPLDSETFINKNIAIYGPSGSGKTVIIKKIMELLRKDIDHVLIISPTALQNESYKDIVDPLCIHLSMCYMNTAKKEKESDAVCRFFTEIMNRQEYLVSCNNLSNNNDNILSLYNKISDKFQYDALIDKIDKVESRAVKGCERKYGFDTDLKDRKIKEAKRKCSNQRMIVYKNAVERNRNALYKRSDISKEEKNALYYFYMNPKLLIVFDDCASDLEKIPKHVISKYFYQNRHMQLTVIISYQSVVNIKPHLRDNAHISIFTKPQACIEFFDKSNNTKEFKSETVHIANEVIKDYNSLVYIREDPELFYYTQFDMPKAFTFGNKAFREFCNVIRAKDNYKNMQNPYFKLMKH